MIAEERPQSKQNSVYTHTDGDESSEEPMDPNIDQQEVNVYLRNQKRN